MLLLCGGSHDPNMQHLAQAAKRRRVPLACVWTGPDLAPGIDWDLRADRLLLDRREVRPKAAFLRYDVFSPDADRPESAFKAFAWYTTLHGYATGHPGMRLFNRRHDASASKPVQLVLASKAGLAIPETWISNVLSRVSERSRSRLVVKPVNGGDYCRALGMVLARTTHRKGHAASPAIVQRELVAPDVRVFQVGAKQLAFRIESDQLDYRTAPDAKVVALKQVPAGIGPGLRRLNRRLGLDFSAADFKADPDDRRLNFLEVNSSPMFVGFDRAAKGRLCTAMLDALGA